MRIKLNRSLSLYLRGVPLEVEAVQMQMFSDKVDLWMRNGGCIKDASPADFEVINETDQRSIQGQRCPSGCVAGGVS